MESAYIENARQPRVHFVILRPPQVAPAKAPIFVIPGFGEHIGRYHETMERWAARGFLVAAHDLRGQGESAGLPGHIGRFDDYVNDAQAVLTELGRDDQWSAGSKPILFGHSTGGLIATHLALRAPDQFRGLALGSPFFGLALKTPTWKLLAGRLLTRVYPTFSQPTGLTGSMISHDPEMIAESNTDPKRISRTTARWFTETKAARARLETEIQHLTMPLFCQAAGEDLIASVAQTRRIFELAGSDDKELLVRDGEFHELHREIKREFYMNAFADRFALWSAPEGSNVTEHAPRSRP